MPNDHLSEEQRPDSSTTITTNLRTSPSLAGTKYAFSRQKLNEIVKALRDCGTEEVVELPKIAVIGNQSAGKSSLIEAISQIRLPRAASTCTRCSTEVILNSASTQTDWHCKVSLRIEHLEAVGQTLGVHDFEETGIKEQVELILRRAQLAILNPSKPPSSFTTLDDEKCAIHSREISFSKNSVVLEITGAEVDVTFIDLPGIISNTERVLPLNGSELSFSLRMHILLS